MILRKAKISFLLWEKNCFVKTKQKQIEAQNPTLAITVTSTDGTLEQLVSIVGNIIVQQSWSDGWDVILKKKLQETTGYKLPHWVIVELFKEGRVC